MSATLRSLGPALGALELSSIARGYVALDAAVKRAVVSVLQATPLSPGKYWIVFHGSEAEVEEALEAGTHFAGDRLVDRVWLPNAHPALLSALAEESIPKPLREAIAALEFDTLSAAVRACDASLKCAPVVLVDLHLAKSIGGKGYLVFTGLLSDVEAAAEDGVKAAGKERLLGCEVIANPDPLVHEAFDNTRSRSGRTR